MIQVCQKKGLEVVHADLFNYFENNEIKFDGIFCSNVIEHMNTNSGVAFLSIGLSIS
jgi:predicted SAM-dependent methyltransferase